LERENRFNGDHWTLESHLTEADAAVQAIMGRLNEAGWTDDEIGQFDVAVAEAINNAITHGNFGIEREPGESSEAYRRASKRRTRALRTTKRSPWRSRF